jgi:hypothetical protein
MESQDRSRIGAEPAIQVPVSPFSGVTENLTPGGLRLRSFRVSEEQGVEDAAGRATQRFAIYVAFPVGLWNPIDFP